MEEHFFQCPFCRQTKSRVI